jgi:hypothetical protein
MLHCLLGCCPFPFLSQLDQSFHFHYFFGHHFALFAALQVRIHPPLCGDELHHTQLFKLMSIPPPFFWNLFYSHITTASKSFVVSISVSQISSTLTTGKSSHKDVDPDNNRLLYIYYSNRYFLYTMCFGNEATFLFLYLSHFWTGPVLFTLPLGDWFNIPPFFSTTVTLVSLLFMIALPISLLKQYINVLQLVQACSDIVELDERYPVNGKKQMVQRARATSPARSPKGSSPRKNK